MKPSLHPRAPGRLPLSLLAGAVSITAAYAQSDVPRGRLTVDRDLVRVGTRSSLAWQIQYPAAIKGIVDVFTIVPRKVMKMRVRVIGVAYKSRSSLRPLDAHWFLNSGSWTNFFYATRPTVNSSKVLVDRTVKTNDGIDFGACEWASGSWIPSNHTGTSAQNVVVLGKGSMAPSHAPAYYQASVTNFLKPYVDASGRISTSVTRI